MEQAHKLQDYSFGEKPNAYRKMQQERDSGTIDKKDRFEEML